MTAIPPFQPVPPPSGPTNNERNAALIAWIGMLIAYFVCGLAAFVPPLVVLLKQGKTSPFARAHAAESLNVFITALIVSTIGSIPFLAFFFLGFVADSTAFIGSFFAIWAWMLVLNLALLAYVVTTSVFGAIRSSNSQPFRPPVTLHLVK